MVDENLIYINIVKRKNGKHFYCNPFLPKKYRSQGDLYHIDGLTLSSVGEPDIITNRESTIVYLRGYETSHDNHCYSFWVEESIVIDLIKKLKSIPFVRVNETPIPIWSYGYL